VNTKLVLVALAATSVVIAQPPQGKRSQRVQRERTAPGGISWAAYGFNGLGIVRLLEVPEIQKELAIDKEVMTSLPLLRAEFTDTDAKYMKELAEASAKSRDDYREYLAVRSKEIDKQMAEILGDRFKRFREIRRQAFGVMASTTSDAVVRDVLAVTEEQRTRFNAERDELVKKFREGASQGKRAVEAAILDQGMRDFGVQEEKLFLSLLSDSQAAKWKELLGEPMVIPEEVVRFIRRGRYEIAGDGDRPVGRPKRDKSRFRKRDPGGNPPPTGEAEKKPPF